LRWYFVESQSKKCKAAEDRNVRHKGEPIIEFVQIDFTTPDLSVKDQQSNTGQCPLGGSRGRFQQF
jgi:hypothetical protein